MSGTWKKPVLFFSCLDLLCILKKRQKCLQKIRLPRLYCKHQSLRFLTVLLCFSSSWTTTDSLTRGKKAKWFYAQNISELIYYKQAFPAEAWKNKAKQEEVILLIRDINLCLPDNLSNITESRTHCFKTSDIVVSLCLGTYLKGECTNQKAKPHE